MKFKIVNMSYTELLDPQVIQPKYKTLALPPGFITKSKKAVEVRKQDEAQLDDLKVKKAWEIATGPAKSLPMTLIMSYMTGNSVQIIPLTMTLMLLINPIKAIFTETNRIFKNLQNERISSDILVSKAVYVLCQLLNLSVGVYKIYKMGLIPNREIDWIDWVARTLFREVLQ